MKRKVFTLTIIALILMSSLAYLPKTQAYDSYISVIIGTGCQSVTITDNTNSSYTDTFTSSDFFEFDAADSLTLSAEADEGYVFSYWRFESVGWYDSTQNPFTVSGDWVNNYDTVTAVFIVPSITVSIDSPTATWYSESPTLSISYDVTGCSLDTILCDLSWYGIPPSGSHNDFEYTVPADLNIGNGQWSLNVTAYSDVEGVVATDSVSFGVNIPNPTTYTITPYHDAHSTITPNTVQTVAEGGSQGFTYSADTGYNISSVKVDGVEVGNTGSYTFTNVVANHNISVTSTAKIQYSDISVSDTIANKTVTLSIYCTSGTNNLSQATWKTNSSGAWSDLTPINFTSLTGWANSSITLNSTIGQIIGYQCNITDIAGNFNVTAIQTLTTKAYYITASNDTFSLLDPLGGIAICYGANQQFNFSALDGYTIENVIINGTYSASTTSPYNFINVQGNQTISVSTSEQVWYVNATSDSGCAIDPTGLLMIPAGTNATFTFSANVGYQLSKLYVNGSETPATNPYVFIPTGNTTLYITSTAISTGLPAGGGGTVITATPTPSLTPEPTDYTFEVDEATKNNIVLSVGVAAIAILIFTVIFARPAKKTVQNYKIEAW